MTIFSNLVVHKEKIPITIALKFLKALDFPYDIGQKPNKTFVFSVFLIFQPYLDNKFYFFARQ